MQNVDAMHLRFVTSPISVTLYTKIIFQFQFFVYDFPNFSGRFTKKFLKHISVI